MDEDKLSFEKPCGPADDVRCYWSHWLMVVLPLFLLVIGTFGNILNVALLSRKTFREKPVFLLLFLSVFDFLVLWTTIPWRSLKMIYDIDYYEISSIFCKINSWMSIFSGSASLWVMAIVSIDRSVVVMSHSQRNVRQNRNKNLALLGCVVTIVLILSGVMALYGHTDEELTDVLDRNTSVADLLDRNMSAAELLDRNTPASDILNHNTSAADLLNLNTSAADLLDRNTSAADLLDRNMSSGTQTCFYVSAEFEKSVPHVVSIALLFELIIPSLAVVIGNIILLTYFCKRRRMFANSQNTDSQTKVLLLLTNFLLITVIPFGITNFVQVWLYGKDNFTPPNLAVVKAVTASLMLSNYALNFLFFFLGGQMFRKEMKLMLEEVKSFWSKPASTEQKTISSNNI